MHAVMNWLWQGGVVAVAASVLLLTLRRTSATARYGVCWGASLLILGLPVLPLLLSATVRADAFLPTQTEPVVSLPDAWWTSAVVIGVAWLLWAWVHLVRLVVAIVSIHHARARSRVFPAHLESRLPHWRRVSTAGRRARLVVSTSVSSAAVLGWGAPMIAVAPSLVRTLSPADLDRVLIHEWAHVQRRDDLANILQVVLRMVAGWHPALWWVDRRLRAEREVACDEMTVAVTGSPRSYAECLMKLSSVTRTPMAMLTAPVVPASGLRARLVRIVSPHPLLTAPWSRGLATTSVLALCVISAMVGGRTLVAAAAFVAPIAAAGIRTFETPLHRAVETRPGMQNVTTARPAPRPRERPLSPPPTRTEQPLAPPHHESLQAGPASPVAELPATAMPDVPAVRDFTAAPADVQPAAPLVVSATSLAPAPAPVDDTSAPEARSPWGAAAAGGVVLGRGSQDAGVAIGRQSQDAGVAIGKASKDAGVATAGFFSRFARRVAGSF
jgi:beta-lactamase regulating signal transducer with metallopeptidase domain